MYRIYRIPKSNGKFRKIMEPAADLKEIQWSLKERLDTIPVHEAAHGFVLNRGIVSNAEVHREQLYVLNIDITNFFPSVKEANCGDLFQYLGVFLEPETVEWIRHACFWDGSLPQGAPTSPVLANLYLLKADEALTDYAEEQNIRYSRYADDMSLSGGVFLKDELPEVLAFVDRLLGSLALKRNTKKTKLMPYYQRQVVTGIVVNNQRLTLPRKLKEELFQKFKGRARESLTDSEIGFLEYVHQVDPKAYDKLWKIIR